MLKDNTRDSDEHQQPDRDSTESISLRGASHDGSGDGQVPPNPTSKHLQRCHYLSPSFCRPPSNLDSKWLLPEMSSQRSVLYLTYQMLSSGLDFPRLLRSPHSQIPRSCLTAVSGLSGKTHPSWPEPPVAPASVALAICGNFAF